MKNNFFYNLTFIILGSNAYFKKKYLFIIRKCINNKKIYKKYKKIYKKYKKIEKTKKIENLKMKIKYINY
jgi:hypothetical protein